MNALTERTLAMIMQQARAIGIKADFYSYNMPDISTFPKLAGGLTSDVTYLGEPMHPAVNPDFINFNEKFIQENGTPVYPFLMKTYYNAVFAIFHSVVPVFQRWWWTAEVSGPAVRVQARRFCNTRSTRHYGDLWIW